MANESTLKLAERISKLIATNKKLAVLTGAGISTDSGIPDYRGPQGTYTIQKDYKPIRYQEFMARHAARQRYWARSFIGFPIISQARPNTSHKALASLQLKFPELLSSIMTQNVDSLHLMAGSRGLVELHGALRDVRCMKCKMFHPRAELQVELAKLNPEWVQHLSLKSQPSLPDHLLHTLGVSRRRNLSDARPDGDVDLGTLNYDAFLYPACSCSSDSILKPNVVFFGENMMEETKVASFAAVQQSDALLVVGSSLEIFSAFRLLRLASERKVPIWILNVGKTRGDDLDGVELFPHRCGDVLPRLVEML